MSKSSKKCEDYEEKSCTMYPAYRPGSCCCNFPMLVILILIVLQFSKGKGFGHDDDDEDCGGPLIDNSILFIIALFFLSCCNPCKNSY